MWNEKFFIWIGENDGLRWLIILWVKYFVFKVYENYENVLNMI